MQDNQHNQEELSLTWRRIRDDAYISSFASLQNSKLYVKKIESSKVNISHTFFLFHDLGSYHERYFKLISWFQEHYSNVRFILLDFEGHGLSSGSRGVVENLELLALDIESLTSHFKKKENETWTFVGHGLGGLVLLEILKRKSTTNHSIDQIILSNFALHLASKIQTLDMKWLGSFLHSTKHLNHTKFFNEFNTKDLLSDSESINKWRNDPLIQRQYSLQTISLINEKRSFLFNDSYFLDKKTLVLMSDSSLVDRVMTNFFVKSFKKDLLSKKLYPQFKHDLYNEKDNEIIFEDIAKWVGLSK